MAKVKVVAKKYNPMKSQIIQIGIIAIILAAIGFAYMAGMMR